MTRRRKLLFLAIYVAFLAVLIEGAARVAFRVPALASRLQVPDGLGWRRQWVQRHKDAGANFRFTFDQFDSTLGWRTRPNIRNMTVYDHKILNTNSGGFRGTQDFATPTDTGTTRILLLGDSFTFGESVSDSESYPNRLQQMLPRAEIMNFGVHGYAHDQMLLLFKEQGVAYNPDIVMLGFVSDDMGRNVVDFRDYAKPYFALENGTLHLEGTPVPTIEHTLEWDWARPRVVDLASTIRYNLSSREAHLREKERMTDAILSEMVRVTDSIKAIPLFVFLPIGKEIAVGRDSTSDEKWFAQFCRAHRTVKCTSAFPQFAEEMAKGVTFKTKGHWDGAGHAVVAQAIARYLTDSGYVRH
ncbi:MAG: SGNH/GDSL hydrolase family protein [bacterium]